MKKSAAAICILLALLTSCGGTSPKTENIPDVPPDQDAAETKKLVLWLIETGKRLDMIELQVEKFMEEHRDIEIDIVQIPNDPYKSKLKLALGGSNPPDVFHSWGEGSLKQYVQAGQVLELTNNINTDAFLPAALKGATFDGKIYGAPLAMTVVPVYYNKEIFSKHELEIPATYEELLTIIDKLNAEKIYPFALANKTKWPAALFLMYFANRIAGNEVFAEAFERNGRGFDDEAYIEAGRLLQELVQRNAFSPGFNNLQYDAGQSRQLIYSGKAAMEIQTSNYINNVRNEAPEFEKKLGIFPFPAVASGEGQRTDIVGGISPVFSVSANSKHPEAAVALIQSLTSLELAQRMADDAGLISAIKGVQYSDPFTRELNKMMTSATSVQTFYDQTLPPELAELHKDTTQALLGNELTPEEAAAQMERLAQEVLR